MIALSERLLAEHGGQVPHDREALEALPGVGRKTANVVLNIAFGETTLAVDTHVFRVAHRLDLAAGKTPLDVELGLLEGDPRKPTCATRTIGSSCTAAMSARRASRAAMSVSCAICAGRRTSGSIAARQGRKRSKGQPMTRQQRQRVPEHSRAHQRARRRCCRPCSARPSTSTRARWSASPTAAWPTCARSSAPRAAPTSTPPTATAAGRRRSPTCCRAATRAGAGERPLRHRLGRDGAR